MIEKTLIIAKPDAVQRGLVGAIISRFEQKGLKLVASKFMHISRDVAEKHYSVHKDKPFFDAVCKYLSSSPVMVMIWEGSNAIGLSRKVIGATSPLDAEAGTIRGDYAYDKSYNLVHGSDSLESAAYEIPLYFSKEEMIEYSLDKRTWLSE